MQYNVQPGVYETISDVSIGTFTLNVVTNFKIDGDYSFLLSDIVIKQGTTIVSASNYTLSIDTTATTQESGQSAKTLYGAIKITNATYAGVELNVSGSNFGTYTDNQATVDALTAGLLTKTEATGSNIQAGEIALFDGTGQNIESNNSGAIDLWATGTTYDTVGTLARLDGDTFTATGKTTNQGFDPTSPSNIEYWYEPEDEKTLKKYAKKGTVIGGDMHAVHDRSGLYYAQNLRVGKKQVNGVDYEFYMVHLDGSVVTGDTTLETILSGYGYLDIFAPEVVGTRTLLDAGEYITTPQSSGGNNDTLGEVLEDRFQGHDHGTFVSNNAVAGTSVSTITAGGTIDTADAAGTVVTDGTNGTPRTGLTTRPKEITVGASYIIIMLAV